MKVSILTPDLSKNCLGRAYILAKMLQPIHDVDIIGPIFGNEIWEPVRHDTTIQYKTVKITKNPFSYFRIIMLPFLINSDIIYAQKPLLTSLGVGIIKKILTRKPLILDIDDWEFGFAKDKANNGSIFKRIKYILYSTIFFYHHNSYWNILLHDKLIRFANSTTVSNPFLKNKYGGSIICHARDTEQLDPDKFDRASLRKKYNIQTDKTVVMFMGSPKPHKGLNDLIEAVSRIETNNLLLLIIGVDPSNTDCKVFVKRGRELLRERFISFGFQPFHSIPEFLSIADLIVIPQKENFFTKGQTPAKVFDAMAMAKPIIATNTGNLADILHNCGIIVPPDDVEGIKNAILYVLNNKNAANELGKRARDKCIREYSWNVVGKTLHNMLRPYTKQRQEQSY